MLFVAFMVMLPCAAQTRFGLVKDEDGYTNIRKGPGTRYAIVGKVRDGSCILCSGDYGDGWFKVYTQTGVFRGYMSASKIIVTESPCF